MGGASMSGVVVADATDWLTGRRGEGPVVVSLPDAREVGLSIDEWRPQFVYWAKLCLIAASGACVFVQTDRKHDGQLESKAGVLLAAANQMQIPLVWHKIALRKPVNSTDLHRPTYSHILAFGECRPGRAWPDVIEHGERSWPNGTGWNVATRIVKWLAEVAPDGPLINPFCGEGTFLRAATTVGRTAIGCDLDPQRVATAQAALDQLVLEAR